MESNNPNGVSIMSKFDTAVQCEETFSVAVLYLSDCCEEYLLPEQAERGICPCCLEHCEVLTEEHPY
jgi:hypothetical protein